MTTMMKALTTAIRSELVSDDAQQHHTFPDSRRSPYFLTVPELPNAV
jgi:hypothetical protein